MLNQCQLLLDNWQRCIWNEPLHYFCHSLTRTRRKYKTLKCLFLVNCIDLSVTGLYWFIGTGCIKYVFTLIFTAWSAQKNTINQTQHIWLHNQSLQVNQSCCLWIHDFENIYSMHSRNEAYICLKHFGSSVSCIT